MTEKGFIFFSMTKVVAASNLRTRGRSGGVATSIVHKSVVCTGSWTLVIIQLIDDIIEW